MSNEPNHFEENPYSAPVHAQPTWQPIHGISGYTRQVRPLCICMIIQGALEIVMGVFWAVIGFITPIMMSQQGGAGPKVPPAQLQSVQFAMTVGYCVVGAIILLIGALRIAGGWRGIYFRSRRLGLISHFFGLLSLLSCYCFPTAIGLCAWGCIVYFRPEVRHAFRMGDSGYSAREIEAGVTQPPADLG